MARDVIITPASGLLDFQGNTGISSATIQLDDNGNLNIANPGGDLTLGDTSRDIFIGNGVNNVDIVFEQDGEIRALTNKTISLGQADSYIRFAGQLLGEIDITQGPLLVGAATSTGTASQRLQVTGGAYVSGNLGIGTTNPQAQLHIIGQIQSTQANSTTNGGGQIYLNGTTGNRIDFNTNGTAAPTFTTRSVGTKIVLYPNVGASQVDYALGIDGSTLWSSVESSASSFKWYAGTTNIATLFGTGQLVLGTTSLTGTASQPLQVTGGAYVSGNLGVGVVNPTTTLTVAGNTANILIGKHIAASNTITLNGSTAIADYNILSTSTNNLVINRPSGKTITFAQANSSHANFDTSNNLKLLSGNLAIGNFTPTYAIDAGAASLNKAGRVGSIIFGTAGTSYGIVGYNAKPSALNAWVYDVTDNASWIQFFNGGHIFYRAVAGTVANSITPLESGRFDSTGNFSVTGTVSGTNITTGGNVTGSSASCTGNAATATSVNLASSSGTISSNVWAGGAGYPGYSYTGGNYRFGFSSSAGVIDVYADGNFYATDSAFLVLHAGNYNSYSPTLTGTGASGSWGISVTGSSASCTASADQAIVNQNNGNAATWYGRILSKNSTSDKAAFLGTYNTIAGVFAHNNALNAWADLYVNTTSGGNDGGSVRMPSSVFLNGNQALHAGNYNSYSPTLTGTGASGSWGISVTGSSASCTGNSATATTAGGGTNSTFFSAGTASEGQIGAQFTGQNSVYLYNNANGWGIYSVSGGSAFTYTRSSGLFAFNGSSSSCSGNAATATTATNQSGGTVSATTGSFSSTVDFTGGSAAVPAVRVRSGGNSWSEGLAIHPSADNGYALTFFRTRTSFTDITNTWAIGNSGASGTNNFALLRNGLTGSAAISADSVFDVTQAGIFRFGFTPTVGSNTVLHAGNYNSYIAAPTSISVSNTSATVTDTGTDGAFTVVTEGGTRLVIDSNGFAAYTGAIGRGAPVTKTGNFTLGVAENWIICNSPSIITVTLPAASSWTGREVSFKTIQSGLISASSNVVPLNGSTAGTAILVALPGRHATLVSDGTNWIIMNAGTTN